MLVHLNLDNLKLPSGVTGIVLSSGPASALADGNMLLSEGNRVFNFDIYETLADTSFPYKDLVRSLQEALVTSVTLSSHLQVTHDLKGGFPESTFPVTDGILRGAENNCQISVYTPSKSINSEQLISLYNEYAIKNNWQRCAKAGVKLLKYIRPALKQFPEREQWELIFLGWENDKWFSGKTGEYDRPKILTMFFKSRYEDFYESGLDIKEGKGSVKNQFLAELKQMSSVTFEEHMKSLKGSQDVR